MAMMTGSSQLMDVGALMPTDVPRASVSVLRADGVSHAYGDRVVLTDLAMPEMSGDQIVAALSRIAPQTPMLVITGFGMGCAWVKWKFWIRVARIIPACIMAKLAPTQTRGPAPNGRY